MLTDTHAHLDFPDFESDLHQVIARAAEAGVRRIVTIGTTIAGSERAIKLAERFPHVFAAVGVHPGNAEECADDFIPALRALAAHPKVVAIGECGLDYYRLPGKSMTEASEAEVAARDQAYKARQAEVFRQQLELAVELGLNVVIHERDSWEDTVGALRSYTGKLRAVFHCFGKSPQHAREILDLGHLVSFTGIVTFKNAGPVKETLTEVPSGSFMVETDCPYLAPVPFRGKRCEPMHARTTADHIALARGISIEALAEATEATAESFYRFSRSAVSGYRSAG